MITIVVKIPNMPNDMISNAIWKCSMLYIPPVRKYLISYIKLVTR